MHIPPTLLLTALPTLLYLLHKYLLHPLFLSPLSRIPSAHPTAPLSRLWILWVRWRQRESREICAAHARLGDVVRLGPEEVSVNVVEGEGGVRRVYGSAEKHAWYERVFTCYGGVRNIFSESLNPPHAARKRLMTHVYSKSHLQNSPAAAAAASTLLYTRILPKMQNIAISQRPVNVYALFNAISMDFVTSYLFGLRHSSNFVENDDVAAWFLRLYEPRREFGFWPQEVPGFTAWFGGVLPLVPAWVADANAQLETWCLGMCDAASEEMRRAGEDGFDERPEDVPVVLQQLANALEADAAKGSVSGPGYDAPVRMKVASEALDHLSAGEETSAVTLTFLFYELARRPRLQERLRDEARSLRPSVVVDVDDMAGGATKRQLPPAKDIGSLPLLHAVLMETLRLHAAIPGPQPRITPRGRKTTLGPHGNIPGDVRVSANAYSLHRNAAVFPEPESWRPERWLEGEEGGEAERERMRWFWAFGSGGRMCIGSHFAMQSMRAVVVGLVGNFRCERVGDEELVQEDMYTAHPVGRELLLRFVRW